MKRSKNQAVYKYLPGMWTGYKGDDYKLSDNSVTIKIDTWNYRDVKDIFTDRIEHEIIRLIKLFGNRGGNIDSFFFKDNNNFRFVEIESIEGIPEILGEVSPLLFYCSRCGHTIDLRSYNNLGKGTWKCPECKTNTMKQLQMIYSCECGEAYPVKLPYNSNKIDYKYKPVAGRNAYKFFYNVGKNEKVEEMIKICDCGKKLLPTNASDNINFKAFNIKTINLINKKEGSFYKQCLDAKKIIIAYWIDLISEEKYNKIIKDDDFFKDEPDDYENTEEFIEKVKEYMDIFDMTLEDAKKAAKKSLDRYSKAKNNSIQKEIAYKLPLINTDCIQILSSQILEYKAIKNAQRVITLEQAIEQQLYRDIIQDEEEIYNINEAFGIKHSQVSQDVEIITSSFGFTRRKVTPTNDGQRKLVLKSFRNKTESINTVYTSKLNTEGIMIELDKIKIINWLYENKIITEEKIPDLDSEESVKKWFAENIKSDEITNFSDINKDNSELVITYYIYTLLHTISHAFIKSAGELSGLDKNSLAEIILPNMSTIFIYSNTSQGIPLGSLSGMFEQNYKLFVKKAKEIIQNCVFDPICSNRDNSSCSSCTYLSEVSCCHFNKDLTRKFVTGYNDNGEMIKGFWEEI